MLYQGGTLKLGSVKGTRLYLYYNIYVIRVGHEN